MGALWIPSAADDSAVHRAGVPSKRVVIVGAGLGGLSAGIHLRLAGHDVEIFESDTRVGGRANLLEHDGFRFDTGPSLLNYPWVFEELFQAAGRNLYDYVSLLPVDPSVSFRWRDGSQLQLSSNRGFLNQEFARFEPDAASRIDRFFADASEKYRLTFEKLACSNETNPLHWFRALSCSEMRRTGVWRSVWSELSRFFESRHIREALGSYAMYLGGSPFDLPGLFTILPYGEMAYGLWLPRGGVYALVEAIERLAIELGIRIYTGVRVKNIETSGGCVSGVRLLSGERITADVVVSNVDLPTTLSELMQEPVPSVKMTPGVVTFYWAVRGRPKGLRHHTIFLPDDYARSFRQLVKKGEIPQDLPFYISVPSATDASLAPAGHSTVFVLVPVPVLSRLHVQDWELGDLPHPRSRALPPERAGRTTHRSDIFTEHCFTPATWQSRFGLYDGSAFGASHNLFQVGPFRAANYSRSHRGLFYVGSSTTPGAGMPMVVLGGRMTAERVAAHVR